MNPNDIQNTAQTSTQSSTTTANFDAILQTLIKDANLSGSTREQGKLFERLVARILQTLSVFTNEFKEVYLWNEFSAKFGINSQDIGIDIMALTHGGEWASVQCKAYDTAHTLAQGDLRNFLGINNITKSSGEHFCDISQKLIFHTCKNESENFRKALEQTATSTSSAKSYGYYALKELNVEWDALNLEDLSSLKMRGKKALRDYQKAALNAIKESFAHRSKEIKLEIHTQNGESKEKRVAGDRAQVIMACGTGKSLLSVRTIDALVGGGELALFFAPSLALINQMLIEFFKESESENYKVFAVCSDTNIAYSAANAITKDSEDIKAADISIPVISNPQNLAAQIKHYQAQGKKIVIFSTYQSIDCVIEAQKELLKNEANPQKFTFKLIINDEAHRTAGAQKLDEQGNKKEISIWQKTHDDELLRAEFRLYMTATPRVYGEKAKSRLKKDEATSDLILFSMDDAVVFGKEIYKLDFDKAIAEGILSDYKVLISFISEQEIQPYIDKISTAAGEQLKFEDAGKMISLIKALKKENIYYIDENGQREQDKTKNEPMRRAVCFHSSIKNSQFIQRNLAKISNEIATEHIDGTHNATAKSQKLDWLKKVDENFTSKVLNNAKCLTEGVDVPNLDAVCFFAPRESIVDTVQAVGRAIRKAEGKKYGYIILPIVLTEEEMKDYDKALKNGKFKVVWEVLKALRSHDPRLIDKARINEVVGTAGTSDPRDLTSPDPTLFALDELFANIKNAIPKNLGDLVYWETYASKVGDIMHTLTVRIKALIDTKPDIKALFEGFCKALRVNLNASFDINEAISLIAQHIITKPIFSHIFAELDFSKFDKVSSELEKLHERLNELGLQAEIEDLQKFYKSVQDSAKYAQSDKAKQDLIRNLYDSLFKSAFKKTQEKLGIVYTPIEVVDFIIHSVEFALQKHFGKSLSDKGVHILDPFTGTGSFITRLIQSGLLDANLAKLCSKCTRLFC